MNPIHECFLFSPDDPMNFLPSDRLSKGNTMRTIPILDVQKQLDDDYRDQIEMLNLKIMDQDDAIKLEKAQNDRLRQSINGLQANWAGHTTLMNDRNAAVARCTSMESEVRTLKEALKVETGNRDHFRALVAQQDAFIKEAKRQIEEFKRKKEEELKSKTGEAEHLARQLLKLKAENAEMATTYEYQGECQTLVVYESDDNCNFAEEHEGRFWFRSRQAIIDYLTQVLKPVGNGKKSNPVSLPKKDGLQEAFDELFSDSPPRPPIRSTNEDLHKVFDEVFGKKQAPPIEDFKIVIPPSVRKRVREITEGLAKKENCKCGYHRKSELIRRMKKLPGIREKDLNDLYEELFES